MSNEYEEIVLINPVASLQETNCQAYDYNIDKHTFEHLIQSISHSNNIGGAKISQYDIIETRLQNMQRVQIIEDGIAIETKTYEVVPSSCTNDPDNYRFIVTKFKRQKIPNVCFPSTSHYDAKRYIRRLVFRLSNRVFLNFQEEAPFKARKVYINVNHSKDAEQSKLQNVIKALKKTITDSIHQKS